MYYQIFLYLIFLYAGFKFVFVLIRLFQGYGVNLHHPERLFFHEDFFSSDLIKPPQASPLQRANLLLVLWKYLLMFPLGYLVILAIKTLYQAY